MLAILVGSTLIDQLVAIPKTKVMNPSGSWVGLGEWCSTRRKEAGWPPSPLAPQRAQSKTALMGHWGILWNHQKAKWKVFVSTGILGIWYLQRNSQWKNRMYNLFYWGQHADISKVRSYISKTWNLMHVFYTELILITSYPFQTLLVNLGHSYSCWQFVFF